MTRESWKKRGRQPQKIQNTLLGKPLQTRESAKERAFMRKDLPRKALRARQGALFPWRRASCGTGSRFGRALVAKKEKAGKAPRYKGQDGCVGWSVERPAKKTWRPSSRIGKRRWPLRECCVAAGIIPLSRNPLGVLGVCHRLRFRRVSTSRRQFRLRFFEKMFKSGLTK